jgi:hypothetical protein
LIFKSLKFIFKITQLVDEALYSRFKSASLIRYLTRVTESPPGFYGRLVTDLVPAVGVMCKKGVVLLSANSTFTGYLSQHPNKESLAHARDSLFLLCLCHIVRIGVRSGLWVGWVMNAKMLKTYLAI